jgi:hypothetical protein
MRSFLSLTLLVFLAHNAVAQRLQLQLMGGPVYSEAKVAGSSIDSYDTDILNDSSLSQIQLGLSANLKLFKRFRLRVEGNYYEYQTNFSVKYENNSGFASGFLINEKISLAVMPEYRIPITENNLSVYGFGGLIGAYEKGDSYAYTNGFRTSWGPFPALYEIARKPETAIGWNAGLGLNLRFGRVGLMAEARYSHSQGVEENNLVGDFKYSHFAVLGGLTFDLLR